MILRLYEPHAARGESVLRFAREIKKAERTNLLEEVERSDPPLVAKGNTLRVTVRPFEVLTLRLEL